jgi:hypothetical protein
MEFIEGIDWVDIYITDEALYVMERLTDLRDVGEYSDVKNIIFNVRNRHDANSRIRVEQEGITFNQIVEVRIFADEMVRDILRFLGSAVGLVKLNEFDIIVNIIIGEWVREEEKKSFDINNGLRRINFANYGEMTYLLLRGRKDLWDRMKNVCMKRTLNKEEGFKMAIIRYLEIRYDLCRELLM